MAKTLFVLFATLTIAIPASAELVVDSMITNGLSDPRSVVLFQNNFYLADSGNHRVLKYAPDTGQLTVLAGVTGRSGTNNGPGFVARFFSPKALVAGWGGLVVADSDNHTLRLINVSGNIPLVTNLAGTVGTAQLTVNELSSSVPASAAHFNTPIGLASDSAGNIYIADSKNNAIRLLVRETTNVVTLSTDFLEPTAIAIGEQTGSVVDVFIADTRNHAIKFFNLDLTTRQITANRLNQGRVGVSLLAGSPVRISGTNDSMFAEEALFNLPSGLMWSGATVGLIVSDTGNHTLRRVFQDPIFQDPIFQDPNIRQLFDGRDLRLQFSVETYAGRPAVNGFIDGPLTSATFNAPIGLVRDSEGDLLIADSGNSALRRIQITPKLPRLPAPIIGWVNFVKNKETGELLSSLVPIADTVFNNDVKIELLTAAGAQGFYNFGTTPGVFEKDTIEPPTQTNRRTAPLYVDGLREPDVPDSVISPAPDVTIKAIATAERRTASEIAQARLRFQAAPPVFSGDNPASATLKTATLGANIHFVIVAPEDSTVPTEASPLYPPPKDSLFDLPLTNALTVRARAFKTNYRPSEIVSKTFLPENFRPNQISFGFESGEASSEFRGSAGQRFIAPVTLALLPAQKIYSMQFNVTVQKGTGAADLTPGAFTFQSMLVQPIAEPVPGFFIDRIIPPQMFVSYQIQLITNVVPQGILITTNLIPNFQDLRFTNLTQNLLGVGWFELVGKTNLYDTISHDLVAYSRPHNTRFLSANGRGVLGGYSFQIPITATEGSSYRIQLNRPSGTDLGSRDVFIDVPTSGSLGAGTLNGAKDVIVTRGGTGTGQLNYIVGDVAPFRWFNAGDFGDTNLVNNDVFEVFQAATYLFNPPPAGTDFFDAMDSCCGTSSGSTQTNVFLGTTAELNSITLGDGVLDVRDVFLTFRRSLDPTLDWVARYWVNGQRQAAIVTNQFRRKLAGGSFDGPAATQDGRSPRLATKSLGAPPFAVFKADDFIVSAGQQIDVPIRAEVTGNNPARLLMLNVTVEPLDGTPPIEQGLQFIPVAQLGQPTLMNSMGPANFAAAWLNDRAVGLSGSTKVGDLRITISSRATARAAYRIHFEHVSASPNGIAAFPLQVNDGLMTARDRSDSSFGDGIPDTWRLRYFGSVQNQLSQAGADADGDGVPNWAEFKAGTNPNDIASRLRMLATQTSGTSGFKGLTLRWPSVRDKIYSIEVSNNLSSRDWATIQSNVLGTGQEMQLVAPASAEGAQFYRVRLVE